MYINVSATFLKSYKDILYTILIYILCVYNFVHSMNIGKF